MSERQRGEGERFKALYPDESSVLAFFAPVKWAGVLRKPGHCLLYPSVTLQMTDRLYTVGMGKQVVKANLRGIYHLAEPREAVNEQALDMAADIFTAKYGAELSLFGALHYFAAYLTEYKSSYGKFDLQDVLRQCGKAYIPWWRARLGRAEHAASRAETPARSVGKEAMWAYLRREYRDKGRSIRESDLYYFGYVPEKDVPVIENTDQLPSF